MHTPAGGTQKQIVQIHAHACRWNTETNCTIEDSSVLMPEQAGHLPKVILVMGPGELRQLVEHNTSFEVNSCYKFLQSQFDEVGLLDSMLGLIARKPLS